MNSNNGWRYYNHALMPSTPPHKTVNTKALQDKKLWRLEGKKIYLARWTSNWDCGRKTSWWYVIKDEPVDLSALNSKKRYEVNKGNKNFYIENIIPTEHKESIFKIQYEAYKEYPEKYRPNLNEADIYSEIDKWNFYKSYGVFSRETNEMVGYALLNRNEKYMYYAVHKVMPNHEKKGVNAALVYGVLKNNKSFLENGGYICDGARNILHETKFQDYLEKYFGFRKAYCQLHIKYKSCLLGGALK